MKTLPRFPAKSAIGSGDIDRGHKKLPPPQTYKGQKSPGLLGLRSDATIRLLDKEESKLAASNISPRELASIKHSYACPIKINVYPHSLLKLNFLTINVAHVMTLNNNILKTQGPLKQLIPL